MEKTRTSTLLQRKSFREIKLQDNFTFQDISTSLYLIDLCPMTNGITLNLNYLEKSYLSLFYSNINVLIISLLLNYTAFNSSENVRVCFYWIFQLNKVHGIHPGKWGGNFTGPWGTLNFHLVGGFKVLHIFWMEVDGGKEQSLWNLFACYKLNWTFYWKDFFRVLLLKYKISAVWLVEARCIFLIFLYARVQLSMGCETQEK